MASVTDGHAVVILFVQDDAELLEQAGRLAREAGYEVLLARGGHDALSIARAVRVDVIVLDLNLPDLESVDLIRRLCADPSTTDVPIVLQSGFAMHHLPAQTDGTRWAAQLVKPCSAEAVFALVDEVVGTARALRPVTMATRMARAVRSGPHNPSNRSRSPS